MAHHLSEMSVPFPNELKPYKIFVDPYLQAKLRQFGHILCSRINPSFPKEQCESWIQDSFQILTQVDAAAAPPRNLRLVLRHDCQSTGCGENGCLLCQYNPSRLCTRNLRPKYLIDDHLRAKCNAALRVELVDDNGACHVDGVPQGVQLELHVLNGEKYKELCPDNTLLTLQQIRNCIITNHTKALLKREGMSDDQLVVVLPVERGQATLSDLTVTTSSEALLSGKAPTFRLLVWAVDSLGEPVNHIQYVVSESFVVATKRVKGAIKSDIPSIGDNVSKLNHIGKATVEKLLDLRSAAREENFEIKIPDALNRIEKVGQFRELVELSYTDEYADLRNKLRHLLKLSPEKWEDVCQHAMSAVVPDFRNRVWWTPAIRGGLLFSAKNGSVLFDNNNPFAITKLGPTLDDPQTIIHVQKLPPHEFSTVQKLRAQAIQAWYQPNHLSWAIHEPERRDAIAAQIIQQSGLGNSVAVASPQMYPPQQPLLAAPAPQLAGVPLGGMPIGAQALMDPYGGLSPMVGPQQVVAQPLQGTQGMVQSTAHAPMVVGQRNPSPFAAVLQPPQGQGHSAPGAAAAGQGAGYMTQQQQQQQQDTSPRPASLHHAQMLALNAQRQAQQAHEAALAAMPLPPQLADQSPSPGTTRSESNQSEQPPSSPQGPPQQQQQQQPGPSAAAQGSAFAPAPQQGGQQPGGGFTKNSPFVDQAFMQSIANAFPQFPADAAPAGRQQPQQPVAVSLNLEMVKTEDLVNVHSMGDPMLSRDWFNGLGASGNSMDNSIMGMGSLVMLPGQGGHQHHGGAADGASAGVAGLPLQHRTALHPGVPASVVAAAQQRHRLAQAVDRGDEGQLLGEVSVDPTNSNQLSMKFSMSLDLDKVVADHAPTPLMPQ